MNVKTNEPEAPGSWGYSQMRVLPNRDLFQDPADAEPERYLREIKNFARSEPKTTSTPAGSNGLWK